MVDTRGSKAREFRKIVASGGSVLFVPQAAIKEQCDPEKDQPRGTLCKS